MISFIVFWVLLSTIQIPCPDANKIGDYGESNNRNFVSDVFYYRTVRDTLHKEFPTQAKADSFIAKAPTCKRSVKIGEYVLPLTSSCVDTMWVRIQIITEGKVNLAVPSPNKRIDLPLRQVNEK